MGLGVPDLAKLAALKTYAEANRIDATTVFGMVVLSGPSVFARDPRHRAWLDNGITVIFSIEDYSKVHEDRVGPGFKGSGWVRHASVSRQVLDATSEDLRVVLADPREFVPEIIAQLGFSDRHILGPSPDSSWTITHALEDLDA